MGDSYKFDGSIKIDPPLNFRQIKEVVEDSFKQALTLYRSRPPRWMAEYQTSKKPSEFPMDQHFPLTLDVEEHEQETEDGILQVKTSSRLKPSHDENRSLWVSMEDQLKRLVKLFPDHTFVGEVIAVNLDAGEAVKVQANGRSIMQFQGSAFIRFTNGDQVKLSDLI